MFTLNNLVRMRPNSTLILPLMVAFVIFILFLQHGTKSEKKQAETKLDGLIKIVEREGIPPGRDAHLFAHFYDISSDLDIDVTDRKTSDWEKAHSDVTDRKTSDWEKAHSDAQCSSRLRAEDTEEIWLDTTFVCESTSYGIVPSPQVSTIYFLDSPLPINARPDFRLWFARNSEKDELYILARVRSAEPSNFVNLKLTVHHTPLREGEGSGPEILYIETNKGEDVFTPHSSIQPSKGRWWSEGKDQQDWFFELALQKAPQIEAIALIASVYPSTNSQDPPTILYRIGTRAPIPLEESIAMYRVSKHLSSLTPYYGVYLREQGTDYRLSGTLHRTPDPEGHLGWLPGTQTLIFRLSFYLSGIGPCPTGSIRERLDPCFLTKGGHSWLRLGKVLSGNKTITMFMEEQLDFPFSWESVLIMLVSGILTYALGKLKQTNESLQSTDRDLRHTLGKLEQTNSSLQSYCNVFLHQAKRRLNLVEKEASKMEKAEDKGSRTKHFEKIKSSVAFIRQALEDSTKKFEYETIVRGKIAKYEPKTFDLCELIKELIEDLLEVADKKGEKLEIEFRPALRDGRRPRLPATGDPATGDPATGDELPAKYFIEALEALVQNAIDYRDPQTKVIISLEEEPGRGGLRSTQAVLRVSNYSSIDLEEARDRVFDIGFRYEGAKGTQGPRSAPESDQKHQGMGLYIVRQIIEAYGGTCQLDNFYERDKSGVKVTVRLPLARSGLI